LSFTILDTVEVIGSIPVAPIVPLLESEQPFDSPSSTPVPPQFGDNLATIRNVPIVPPLSLCAGSHMPVDFIGTERQKEARDKHRKIAMGG
jgi:hypothetical protein